MGRDCFFLRNSNKEQKALERIIFLGGGEWPISRADSCGQFVVMSLELDAGL